MKVLFIGTVKFSQSMLRVLIKEKVEIVGVVTSLDDGLNSDYSDLRPLCKKENIPFHITNDINSNESIKWINSSDPNLITCFGWSRLLKKELLGIPKLGVLGFHPAELPKNRGRHPIIWSLVLGLNRTASTFFFMGEGADDGDIVSQEGIEIKAKDNSSTLYKKMTKVAENQLPKIIKQLKTGTNTLTPQDHSKANIWRKRTEKDGEIDWRMGAESIHNLVRALAKPYPGAHFIFKKEKYKVWRTKINTTNSFLNIEPGKIIKINKDKSIIVKCSDFSIEIIEFEPSIRIKAGDYL